MGTGLSVEQYAILAVVADAARRTDDERGTPRYIDTMAIMQALRLRRTASSLRSTERSLARLVTRGMLVVIGPRHGGTTSPRCYTTVSEMARFAAAPPSPFQQLVQDADAAEAALWRMVGSAIIST
jgi:hypothetical protein